ncbi:MAG: hypothetical protein WCQ72_03535 [Eubacteriales bacterium]
MYYDSKIASLRLPDIMTMDDKSQLTPEKWRKRRLEMLSVLEHEEYGHAPRGPFEVNGNIYEKNVDYGGKVSTECIHLTVDDRGEGVSFGYDIQLCVPTGAKTSVPLILLINFRPDVPDKYMPVEEICDRGCAVARIYYNDITNDKNDGFTSGIAACYDRKKYDWGKISMWAWSMSRALDYLTRDERFDLEKLAVAGHSRLGKTSLWCGANDERVKYIFVNDSGCSGDAVTRCKRGEHIADITRAFPVWFGDNYVKYAGNEDTMPFDQHFLVACCAPRHVYGGSAAEDEWADPLSQYYSYIEASKVYKLLGLRGLCAPDRALVTGDIYAAGDIAFHMRPHGHFFSRADWKAYIDFLLA